MAYWRSRCCVQNEINIAYIEKYLEKTFIECCHNIAIEGKIHNERIGKCVGKTIGMWGMLSETLAQHTYTPSTNVSEEKHFSFVVQ